MRQEYVPSSISKCAATSQSATTWSGWCVRLDLLLVEQFVWDADVAAVSSAKVNQYADGAKALTSKTLLTSLQFDDANALEAMTQLASLQFVSLWAERLQIGSNCTVVDSAKTLATSTQLTNLQIDGLRLMLSNL